MVMGRWGPAMGTLPYRDGSGAIKVGTGWISGHRITPGTLSVGKLSPVGLSIGPGIPRVCPGGSAAGYPPLSLLPADPVPPRARGARLPTVKPPASNRLSISPTAERQI